MAKALRRRKRLGIGEGLLIGVLKGRRVAVAENTSLG
jgi:hypothetical protein